VTWGGQVIGWLSWVWLMLGMATVGRAAEPVPAKPVIAVLPATASPSARAVADALDVAFEGLALLVTDLELLTGRPLEVRLSAAERGFAVSCGLDARCLTRFAKKLQVRSVLVSRVELHSGAYLVQLTLVDGTGSRKRQRISFSVAGPAAVETELGRHREALFGAAPVESEDDVALPDLVPLEREPTATTTVAPAIAPAVIVTSESHEGRTELAITGWVLAGGAVAAGAAASLFAWQYRDAKNSIDAKGALTTPQKRAVALETEANRARGRSFIGLGVAVASGTGALACWWWGRRVGLMPAVVAGEDLRALQWQGEF